MPYAISVLSPRRFLLWSGIAAGMMAWTTSTAMAAPEDYLFTKIVDNSGEFETFGLPSINNSGAVAFQGLKDSGVDGVYVAPALGPIETIADSTGEYDSFEPFSSGINAGGTVAFRATLDSGEERIAVGMAGEPAVTVAETSADVDGFANLADAPSINNAGLVAFAAELNSDAPGPSAWPRLFTWQSPGLPTSALDTTGEFDSFFIPFLNNSGTMVFFGSYDDAEGGGGGVFTRAADGTVTSIADSDDAVRGVLPYNIADDGTVVFQGQSGPADEQGLYISSGGGVTQVADESGAYGTFLDMKLNNAGMLVFSAMLDSGDTGIFAGPDPVADRVLVPGDTLFGEEVTAAFFAHGLNDNGEIAFLYQLETDEVGIAVARIPEPASAALLSVAAVGLLGRCLVRRLAS